MELKFAVVFSAIDQFSSSVGAMGRGLGEMGEKLASVGDRVEAFGARLAITSAVIAEGAEKIHQWGEALVEPAIGMGDALARVSAITGIAGAQLDAVRRHALDFSAIHPGASADQWVAAYTPVAQVFQNVDEAMKATDVTAQLAFVTQSGMAESANLLTTVYANLRTPVAQAGDTIAAAMRQFRLAEPGQFAMALGQVAGAAQGTNTSLTELVAILGEAGLIGGGGRGSRRVGSALMEFIQQVASGKVGGIDLSHGMLGALDQLQARVQKLSGPAQLRTLEQAGFGGQAATILNLLNHLDEIHEKLAAIGAAAPGALGAAVGTQEKGPGSRIKLLHQNLLNLFDAISTPAMPAFVAEIQFVTGAFERLSKFFEAHQTLGKVATVGLVTLGTALTGIVGTLMAVGTIATLAGQGMKTFAAIAKGLPMAISAASTALGWLSTALAAVNAAALPILAIGAGIAAVAVAGYLIWRYWGPITGFFKGLWTFVKSIDWSALGWGIMRGIGSGILAGAKWVLSPITWVAEKIWAHFPHSPATEGPLRNLHRIRLVETIAETMRPAPIMAATRRIAAAAAIAAPMALAPGAAAAGGGIVVNVAPASITINAGPGQDAGALRDELIRVLRRHDSKLARTIAVEVERVLARKRRVTF